MNFNRLKWFSFVSSFLLVLTSSCRERESSSQTNQVFNRENKSLKTVDSEQRTVTIKSNLRAQFNTEIVNSLEWKRLAEGAIVGSGIVADGKTFYLQVAKVDRGGLLERAGFIPLTTILLVDDKPYAIKSNTMQYNDFTQAQKNALDEIKKELTANQDVKFLIADSIPENGAYHGFEYLLNIKFEE